MAIGTGAALFVLWIGILFSPALSDFVISKLDREIDLRSQIVRTTSKLKIENIGPGDASDFQLTIPNYQATKLAFFRAIYYEGAGKTKKHVVNLQPELVESMGMPSELTVYSVSLPHKLQEGKSFSLDVLAVYISSFTPFPEEITQADAQLVIFQDSAYYLSPYSVKAQSLKILLPSNRVESFTKLQNAKLKESGQLRESEINYGPYDNLPAFSYSTIVVHFENNRPFAVAQELLREIEISHWGNVQITEYYTLVHAGARIKGGFSRFDYQARHTVSALSAFNKLFASLPPWAHSVYYRDEIGNVSTSNMWSTSTKTELVIEPRYPMLGGWRTAFTIGYGLPLKDFLFEKDGRRFLNITFGCPINDVVVENLIVKVILPEGSKNIGISLPFPTKQWHEVKYSHLDIVGRPVVAIQKTNVIPELNEYFQVYYGFNNLSLLFEPLMLITGFFFFFVACIAYMHVDISISKSSASYLAKLQLDEVQAAIQQVQNIVNQCLAVHDKLETSLRDLSRTGDVQSCKTVRKNADGLLKDLNKDLKPLLVFLQSAPQAGQIWPKVDELLTKEKEMQEKLMLKHSMVVDSFEKKHGAREMDNRIAPVQQKLSILRQEVDDLLDVIDEF